jgi:hypothetical protein
VDTSQQTVTQALANARNAPGLGAQVICMDLISWGSMLGTASMDGHDRRFDWSLMTPVGCSSRGLVLL